MNDSRDQQVAQRPSPVTGSRHETHSVGNAISSAVRAVAVQALRQADQDLAHASPSLPLSADPLTREVDAPAPVPIPQG